MPDYQIGDDAVLAAVITVYNHKNVNPYARAYAECYMAGERNRVQILYILNNMNHMRDLKGESKIKEARQILKDASK